jgi:hypothetical protein
MNAGDSRAPTLASLYITAPAPRIDGVGTSAFSNLVK